MSRLMDSMENTLMPIAGKISGNRYLNAIRDGFTLALPLIIIGAMFLLVANIPIEGYGEFMAGIFGASWADFFNTVFNATMNLMTIFVIWGMANSLAGYYEVDGLSSAAITFAAFLVITPMSNIEGANYIPFEWMGAKGLFVAILTAILAVEIFRFVVKKGWTIKMPEGVPPSVSRSFSALIPAFIILVVFSLIRLGFAYTSYETVHGFIFTVLQQPLTIVSRGLGASLVANLFISLFWVFGIHGAQIVGAVMSPIWVQLSAENLAAYDAGAALPNIVTQQFQEIYLQLGGSGCTLALCIAMLLFARSQQVKQLGRLAILPGLFNINEPITFGLPIVLNPIMMIPFILTPMILSVVCYFAISLEFVPRPSGVIIPWTTPPIIGGFLMAGFRGAILQMVELVIAFFIYFPFFKVVDNQYYKQEQEFADESVGGATTTM